MCSLLVNVFPHSTFYYFFTLLFLQYVNELFAGLQPPPLSGRLSQNQNDRIQQRDN
jgi:hypothetical protein